MIVAIYRGMDGGSSEQIMRDSLVKKFGSDFIDGGGNQYWLSELGDRDKFNDRNSCWTSWPFRNGAFDEQLINKDCGAYVRAHKAGEMYLVDTAYFIRRRQAIMANPPAQSAPSSAETAPQVKF